VAGQTGHEIKVNLKNCNDSLVYLTFYQFDKNMIADTCRHIKNGKIIFKGKKPLQKGIYSVVGQAKSIYFDFYVDENTQRMEIAADAATNFTPTLNSSTTPLQNDFLIICVLLEQKEMNLMP